MHVCMAIRLILMSWRFKGFIRFPHVLCKFIVASVRLHRLKQKCWHSNLISFGRTATPLNLVIVGLHHNFRIFYGFEPLLVSHQPISRKNKTTKNVQVSIINYQLPILHLSIMSSYLMWGGCRKKTKCDMDIWYRRNMIWILNLHWFIKNAHNQARMKKLSWRHKTLQYNNFYGGFTTTICLGFPFNWNYKPILKI